MDAKLEMLSNVKTADLPQRKITMRNVLLTLNVAHRNFVKNNMMRAATAFFGNTLQQEWFSHIRFYWNDDVKVIIDAYELDYGYEYLGVIERLVVTDLTRSAYIKFGQACLQNTKITVAGPAGTGKTETAKDFFMHLGRLCIIINCNDEFTDLVV